MRLYLSAGRAFQPQPGQCAWAYQGLRSANSCCARCHRIYAGPGAALVTACPTGRDHDGHHDTDRLRPEYPVCITACELPWRDARDGRRPVAPRLTADRRYRNWRVIYSTPIPAREVHGENTVVINKTASGSAENYGLNIAFATGANEQYLHSSDHRAGAWQHLRA